MSKHPRFAHFHKCDLQMQTPGDHHYWVGTKSKLTPASTDADLAAAATAYVDRLYEVELDVVGITDHNMGGELGLRFLEALLEETKAQAGARGKRITVFPGFELVAQAPGAMHLLCLFEPGMPQSEVSDVLTVLGLPPAQRLRGAASNFGLDDVLRCVGEHDGIVVAAHADRANGTLDDKRQAQVWQQSAITNERLLCIELSEHRDAYAGASGKLGMIVRNDPGPWHRPHPIAVVNSSDCKRLDENDGSGDEGWIGKRHTWIKMSKPLIEGLRQAFLDHDSRIRFGPDRPEDEQRYDRIERISVAGVKFLDDQEIELSPNLNAFIGGGGTGKSTILEYIRGLLGRPPTDKEIASNHDRAMATAGGGTVRLHLRQGDDQLVVNSNDRADRSNLADRFPIVAFSQREIYAVAESEPATLALIDGLQRDQMDELRRTEARARDTLRKIDTEVASLPVLQGQQRRVAAEIERFEAMLTSVEAQQQPLAALNQLRRETEAVENVDSGLERVAEQIEAFAESLTLGVGQSGFRSPDTPHAEQIDALLTRARAAVDDAAASVTTAAAALRSTVAAERQRDERTAWTVALKRAEAEYRALLEATGGEADEQPQLLRQQISDRRTELAALDEQIEALRGRLEERPARLATLRDVWDQQVAARRGIASALKELVPSTATGEPYVDVQVRPFADTEPLRARLNEWVHGQALTTAEAEQLCAGAAEEAAEGNPVEVVVDWIRALGRQETPGPLAAIGLRPAACLRLGEIPEERLRELERVRLDDKARVRLRRQDGSVAGWLDEGLSVGQRCTAIVALALAAGSEPIVIDQPEDEIDNEFIYTELVPLLRNAKNQRQVIIATHNPNLPVNGDAELIYALEARREGSMVRGVPKKVGSDLAIGSLDRRSVREAVELIMEGSKEAFDRRRVRYGF